MIQMMKEYDAARGYLSSSIPTVSKGDGSDFTFDQSKSGLYGGVQKIMVSGAVPPIDATELVHSASTTTATAPSAPDSVFGNANVQADAGFTFDHEKYTCLGREVEWSPLEELQCARFSLNKDMEFP